MVDYRGQAVSALNKIENEVVEAYRRGDLFIKRRQLMEDWARYCASPPVVTTADVVSINRARR